MQENQLIEAICEGDERAFSQLIDQYRPMVIRITYRIVQDMDDTEDLAQEVFLKIWQTIGTFKGDSSLKTWIYRLAVNKALNFLKWKKIRTFILRQEPLNDKTKNEKNYMRNPEALKHFQQKEDASAIEKALSHLPSNQRAAFSLSKAEGLSNPEIATILNITIGAVESLIFRAKKSLQIHLSTYYKTTLS